MLESFKEIAERLGKVHGEWRWVKREKEILERGRKRKNKSSFWVFVHYTATAAAKSRQSCPTLCDPIDGSPWGSPVPGILQARTLEWVAISFSNAWKWKVKVKSLSRVQLFATPWTAAQQAPRSMGFSRHEYWSGLPFLKNLWRQNKKYISYIMLLKTALLPPPYKWKLIFYLHLRYVLKLFN